jgi:hypothetical protein
MAELALITAVMANVLSGLKNAKDLATATSNTELKEQLGFAYDDFNTLRERLLDVVEENRALKAQVEERKKVDGPVPPFGYFFLADDPTHPLCPKCYQGSNGIGFMTPAYEFSYGLRRDCRVCGHTIWEEQINSNRPNYRPERGDWA